MRRLILVILTLATGLAACTTVPATTSVPASTKTPLAQPPQNDPPATLAPTTAYTPIPTVDFVSYLVTQAYQNYTPEPPATDTAEPPTPVVYSGPVVAASPTAVISTASSVYLNEPIQIANAVNTADCKIRNVGNCTPAMKTGISTYFTWTFGVQSSQIFSWGQAAVVIVRDGQQIVWTQVGNGLQRPPGKDKGWTLRAGQKAEFRAGLEKLQPGHYTARLAMCTLSPTECNAGQGWQNVGGEAIDFVITP